MRAVVLCLMAIVWFPFGHSHLWFDNEPSISRDEQPEQRQAYPTSSTRTTFGMASGSAEEGNDQCRHSAV